MPAAAGPVGGGTLTITTIGPSSPAGHVDRGTQYNSAPFLQASGGTGPYTFSNGSMPKAVGIQLNSNGTITGYTCGANGSDTVTVSVTDQGTSTTAVLTVGYTINIAPAASACALSFSGASPTTTATVGVPYSSSVSASGGTAPYTYSLDTGTLPPGLTLNTSGTVTGTPTTPGTYSFVVYGTDSASPQDAGVSGNYTITVAATSFAITTTTLPASTVGQPYSTTIGTSGGPSPVTFALTAGSLPAGLSLNAQTGVVSGTPTTAGPYSFTVTATDASANTATQSYSGTIAAALTITTVTLPTPLIAQPYSATVSTAGGTAPISFTISAGALPAGLTLNSSTGVISGTPSATGAYSVTVEATDANNVTATQAYTGTIVAPLAITTTSLPTPLLNQAYSQTVQTSGGTGAVTFSLSSGALPAGLTLNASTGLISGTPAAAGAYSFTVQAKDANNVVATQAYSGTIVTLLAITTATLPTPQLHQAYSQTVQTSGGTSPITFTVSSGALPAGLALNASTGVISGSPTASGPYSFTIQAKDANTITATQNYTGTILPGSVLAITTTSLPAPVIGQPYGQTIQVAGASGAVSFSIAAGSLPAGLALNGSTGVVSGTPSTFGIFSFTVKAQDATSNVATQAYAFTIAAPVAITTTTLPPVEGGQPYSQTVQTTGGTAPFTFAVTAGSLPAGLTLNPTTGVISGMPTASGPYSFTVTVTDANGKLSSVTYSGTIAVPLTVTTTTLPTPVVGQSYDQTVQTNGGLAPMSFSISAGALPAGLTLDPATGVISGSPTTAGSYSFTVKVVDALGVTRNVTFSGTAGAGLVVSPGSLPAGTIGVSYAQTVAVSGGTAPYTLRVASGALPSGLSLNGAVITGRPTSAGTSTFSVQAIDASGDTVTQTYTLTIAVRPNPSLDPDVRGLVLAEVAALERFAGAQIDNVTRHLEQTHAGCTGGGELQIANDAAASPIAADRDQNRNAAGLVPVSACGSGRVALWAAGSFAFGSASSPAQLSFHTSGTTAGVDARLSKSVLVGFAAGSGFDGTAIGVDGSSLRSTSTSVELFASYKPRSPFYLDGVAGFDAGSFNANRFNAFDGSFISGHRDGHATFGSLAAGFELQAGRLMFAPYVRASTFASSLAGTSENTSDPAWALTLAPMQASETALLAGLRGEYPIPTRFGSLTPTARLEYGALNYAAFLQNLQYADGLGPTYAFSNPGSVASGISGSLGLRMSIKRHYVLELDYDFSAARQMLQSHTLRPSINITF